MADRRFIHQKNIDNTLDTLKKVLNLLDENKIKYYLDFGTLLGSAREKGFIPWDDDVDISLVDEQDYQKIPSLLQELSQKFHLRTYIFTFKSSRQKREEKGRIIYEEKGVTFTDATNYQIAKIRNNKFWRFGRGNVNIDIFFKYMSQNSLYWYADGKSNKIDTKFLENGFKKVKFYNLECSIPVDYDLYLTQLYGDWQTPNESWTENDSITQVSEMK